MSKVIRFHEMGGPNVLKIDELPVPDPNPGEVRIAVGAIGLNRVEAMFRSGQFLIPELPSRIGYEAAGTVDAVGPGVTDFAQGDRVATLPGLSMETYGTYGEEILYPADRLVKVPDNQPVTESSATWMQYLTAYGLIAVGKIKAGDYVAITAASSSVGLAAIQICNAVGAIPIAITRGQEKTDGLFRHGAVEVVVSGEQDVTEALMKLTEGHGIAVAFDAVAGQQLASLIDALKPKGIAIVYGSLAGVELPLQLPMIMLNCLTFRGFAANELIEDPAQRQAAVQFIYDGLASGKLKPVIDRVFKLDQVVEAHRYLEGNTQLGKIVLAVD